MTKQVIHDDGDIQLTVDYKFVDGWLELTTNLHGAEATVNLTREEAQALIDHLTYVLEEE